MALIQSYHSICAIFLFVIVIASAEGYGYGSSPKEETTTKSKGQKFLPEVFSVQGIVYCKSGSKVSPFKGSVVRIACLGVDKDGYETAPFSILTRPTDGNGYFLAKLSAQPLADEGCKIFQCKAFLHSSPIETCRFATNINMGSSGALLSNNYRLIGSNNMRLYSVGPFVYSSEPDNQSSPYGY